jgi:predicted CXXCH cytochrome family protein
MRVVPLRPSEKRGEVSSENLEESCLTCHDLPIRVDGRSLENVAEAMRVSKVVHPAMIEKGCQTCHTPHGADQPSLLRQGYPAGMYEAYKTSDFQVCWQCHDAGLAESADGYRATRFRDGPTNLHRVHVVEMKRGRACHICHTAHASEIPYLLRETIRFKQWDAPMELTLTDDGGSCATPCHAERAYRRTEAEEDK